MKTLQTYQEFKYLLESKETDLANNRVKQAKIEDTIKKNKEMEDKLEATKKGSNPISIRRVTAPAASLV